MADNPLEVKLLPCRRCGEAQFPPDYRVSSDGEIEWYRCGKCGFEGGLAYSKSEAADLWNTRATPDQMAGVDGEVTQADRNLASDLISRHAQAHAFADEVRQGRADAARTVQDVARHRRAAVAAERERCARVVEEFGDTKQYPAHSVTTAVRDLAIANVIRQEPLP